MKKLQMMFVGVLGVAASGMTMAAPIAIGAGGTTLTILQCTQLANDTNVVLSANVAGAADCDDATFIGLSACHSSGLQASRSANVAPTAPVAPATVPTCTAPLTLTGTAPNQRCTGTVTGASFPTATTGQGTVISAFPGAACTPAAVAGEATKAVAALQ